MKNIYKFILFIIIILLLTIILYVVINPTKNKNPQKEEEDTIEFKKYSFYKEENKKRYIAYQQENKNLSLKQIIINVNIGLDKPYYTNIKESNKLNDLTILVNKYVSLPADYVPENLEPIDSKYARNNKKLVHTARIAFEEMASAAEKESLQIIAMSTYRSYEYQKELYTNYVQQDGQETTDTYSARPGHSEHQTGLAADIYNGLIPYTSFENTKEFKWMQENAYKYGFILRYPKDKVEETGYQYESWHYRYVGKEIATYIHQNKITYDEYYIENLDKN